MRSVGCSVFWLVAAQTVAAEPPCISDDELSRVAASLLSSGDHDAAAIRAAVVEAGSDAVAVHALMLPSGLESPSTGPWLARLSDRADAPLACGRAHGEHGTVVLATARAGRLAPLSRRSPLVSGWLAPGFSHPELVVMESDGHLVRIPVSRRGLSAGVRLDSKIRRPARVQLLASGRMGPRPVAERTLPAVDGAADLSAWNEQARDPQAPIAGQLNRLRATRQVPGVRRHSLLRRLAAKHAQRVCQTGRIGHALGPGADPEARLRGAGVRAVRVGETVARAAGPAAAFIALQRSPSHLMTLLEPSFTDGGVGVATDPRGNACVVVLLARWPRFVGR